MYLQPLLLHLQIHAAAAGTGVTSVPELPGDPKAKVCSQNMHMETEKPKRQSWTSRQKLKQLIITGVVFAFPKGITFYVIH